MSDNKNVTAIHTEIVTARARHTAPKNTVILEHVDALAEELAAEKREKLHWMSVAAKAQASLANERERVERLQRGILRAIDEGQEDYALLELEPGDLPTDECEAEARP